MVAQSFEQLTGFVYQIWLYLTGFTVLRFVCVRLFSCIICACMHVVLLKHGEVSLVRLRPVWMTNHPPSVL